jgi:hypothetical protein
VLNLPSHGLIASKAAQPSSGQCDLPLIDPICEAGKAVASKAGDVVTAPFRYAANSAVDGITAWVADTARWIVGRVISFIDTSTTPSLDAAWFSERYRFMVGLAALIILPMLLMAAIRAVMTQDASQLIRSFLVHLPVAVLGTFAAVVITQSLLTITDSLSQAVSEGVGQDATSIFDSIGSTLGASGIPGVPSFAIFFVSLILILGSFLVWLELLVRSAALTVCVFFMPMFLAAMVWPATSRWTRRMIETLAALILSKFVIVAVISLATAALADHGKGGFGSLMGGTSLMLMAAFSPMALLKLMPLAESAAVGHLQGLGRKPIEAVRPGSSAANAMATMRSKMAGTSTAPNMSRVATVAGGGAGAAAIVAAAKASKVSTPDGMKRDVRGTEKGAGTRSTPKPPRRSE